MIKCHPVLTDHSWSWNLGHSVASVHMDALSEKTDPPPCQWSSSANKFLIGVEVHVCFLSQHRDPIWLEPVQVLHMMAHFLWSHMCISHIVSGRHCFLRGIHSLLALSLSSQGKGMMKTFHLGLRALSLSLSARCSVVDHFVNSHLFKEEASLMGAEWDTGLWL